MLWTCFFKIKIYCKQLVRMVFSRLRNLAITVKYNLKMHQPKWYWIRDVIFFFHFIQEPLQNKSNAYYVNQLDDIEHWKRNIGGYLHAHNFRREASFQRSGNNVEYTSAYTALKDFRLPLLEYCRHYKYPRGNGCSALTALRLVGDYSIGIQHLAKWSSMEWIRWYTNFRAATLFISRVVCSSIFHWLTRYVSFGI